MRWRIYLVISLVLNFLLAVGWLLSARGDRLRHSRAALGWDTNAPAQTRTNVLIRRQVFTWREVESDDYPTYIANLRDIGCPEQTIRDIIIAEINSLFARRRAMEVVTPEQQWWRTDPDTNVMLQAVAKVRELDRERRELLTRLLGEKWESGDLVSLPRPSREPIPLDGPVLGQLPNDVKHQVEEISLRTQDRIQAYMAAQRAAGKPVDPVELAKLRQQTRVELAGVLSPLQLEEFLLRYSQSARDLRAEFGQLKYFNATPDEFRAVFRVTDPFDQQLELLAGATDASSVALRRSLEQRRLAAIQNVLGPERFELYQLLQNQGYREAYAAAAEAGAPESTMAIYQINQAVSEELARIRADTNLTPELRAIEEKKAELEQLKAVAQAMGQQVPPEEPPMPPEPPPSTAHVLKSGEGLSFLTRFYNVNPADLRAANPNVNFDRLRGGESINIPVNPLNPLPAGPPVAPPPR